MENINPISDLMQATMDNVKNMLKVDTVVGDPIYTPDGITLVPISKVSVGFGGGGDREELSRTVLQLQGVEQRRFEGIGAAEPRVGNGEDLVVPDGFGIAKSTLFHKRTP